MSANSSSSPCKSVDAPRFYFLGKSKFSIFEKMAELLDLRGDWQRQTNVNVIGRCALVLGDRFDIPYNLLRSDCSGVQTDGGRKQLLNYFKGSHRLTLKASMARLLRETVPHVHEYMPLSFVLGHGSPKSRFQHAVPEDERSAFLEAARASPERAWIVKPSAGCKGQGIVLFLSAEEVIAHVDALVAKSPGLFAVQAYVPNPMLLAGNRKFDIRVWALLTHPYDMYIYSQGSCRTASVPYDAADLSNALRHLTNHDLQRGSSTFGEFEDGNELWYSTLNDVIKERTGGAADFYSTVQPQISRIVVDSLYALKEIAQVGDHEPFECFQLFGFDLLLDDQLKVHLIEINGSPGAADRWLVPMVNSMIQLVVDERFPPRYDDPQVQRGMSEINSRIKELEARDNERGTWIRVWSLAENSPPYMPLVPCVVDEPAPPCLLSSSRTEH